MPDSDNPNRPVGQNTDYVGQFTDLMFEEAKRRRTLSENLAKSLAQIEDDITNDFERIKENASCLPNGTAVFMSQNLSIYKEDGEELPDNQRASVQ